MITGLTLVARRVLGRLTPPLRFALVVPLLSALLTWLAPPSPADAVHAVRLLLAWTADDEQNYARGLLRYLSPERRNWPQRPHPPPPHLDLLDRSLLKVVHAMLEGDVDFLPPELRPAAQAAASAPDGGSRLVAVDEVIFNAIGGTADDERSEAAATAHLTRMLVSMVASLGHRPPPGPG